MNIKNHHDHQDNLRKRSKFPETKYQYQEQDQEKAQEAY